MRLLEQENLAPPVALLPSALCPSSQRGSLSSIIEVKTMSMLTEKQCTKCHEVKSLSDFYRESYRGDGYRSCCKACDCKSANQRIRARPPEYRIWSHLRHRCNNLKDVHYHRYGGRGISVCDRWDSFDAFLSDMGPRPSFKHQIDRIDNDGNYEPGNCRWATAAENVQNSTTAKLTEEDVLAIRTAYAAGQSQKDIAKQHGVTGTEIWRVVTGKTWRNVGGPIVKSYRKAKVTPEQVVAIRYACEAGQSQKSLQHQYGMSQSQISRIVTGDTWCNAGGPIAAPRAIKQRRNRKPYEHKIIKS